jgi:undecaprenyl diphosphate synthase
MNSPAVSEVSQEKQQSIEKKQQFFTQEQLDSLCPSLIPQHIAIIPDGNRRWAMKQDSTHIDGHRHGADIIIDIVKAAKEIGVKAITFYTFSTENWNRPPEEVDALMWLIKSYLTEQKDKMVYEGIRLQTIGDDSKLSNSLLHTIEETKKATAHCCEVTLILAINYGGRDDVTRAVHQIIEKVEKGQLKKEEINEQTISQHLDTLEWNDPELMIRTSGEMRISNFLIWQLTYSEIYVVDILWPDFSPKHLFDAIVEYQVRERRLGN